MLDRLRRLPSIHVFAYSMSGGLINLIGLAFGPLILRKLGLEDYGALGLAMFVSGLMIALADFGLQSHLLSLCARGGGRARREDILECLVLRLGLILTVLAGYLAYLRLYPHPAEVRALVGLYLLALVATPSQFEWYYLGQRRNRVLVISRLVSAALFASLNLAWLLSPIGLLGQPLVMVLSQAAASAVLLAGMEPGFHWLKSLRPLPDKAKVVALGGRLSPLVGTQLLSFFFLGSGVFLLERIGGIGPEVGAYSIANRLIMGLLGLSAPLILYFIPRVEADRAPAVGRRNLVLGAASLGGVAVLGVAAIRVFYAVSGRDFRFQDYSTQVFLILMAGVALNLFRVPWVSSIVAAGRYRAYFLLHLLACLPVLSVAAFPRILPDAAWVPWLACLSEALATAGAVWLGRGAPRPEAETTRASGQEREPNLPFR